MLMTFKQLFRLEKLAGLSPEQFGPLLGISGMTLRRWKHMPSDDVLPDIYAGAAARAVHKLVADGRLSADAPAVKDVLKAEWLPFEIAAQGLGVSTEVLDKLKEDPNGAVDTLSEIGSNEGKRNIVDSSVSAIRAFEKKGKDWTYRIGKLLEVVRSRKLRPIEKVVAYGALFYLLNPFDFIPDHIPVFGLLDDFFFLSVALTFYLRRYPEFFDDEKK